MIKKNDFIPIKNRRLSESVVDQLKESILNGNYNPGDRLPSEKDLCESFKVGRPVIREAMRVLENYGVLFIRPGAGGGAFIKKLDSNNLLDSFEMIIKLDKLTIDQITEARLVIEKAILPLVFERIRRKDMERLENSINLAREGLEKKIVEPKNLEFHILLSEISENPLLIMITKALFDVLRKFLGQFELSFERKKRVLDSHELILESIRTKNLDNALEVMGKHIKELSALIPKEIRE